MNFKDWYLNSSLAARSFGSDRVTYEDNTLGAIGTYRERSTGYFDHLIPNARKNALKRTRISVIHAQEANRDNLFMGYFLHENPDLTYTQIEIFQISP